MHALTQAAVGMHALTQAADTASFERGVDAECYRVGPGGWAIIRNAVEPRVRPGRGADEETRRR